ncbi:MAG: ShlB/FhaC/HecB family hemolysin secretion/activation protein [Cyanobacteria bacterium P01_B01_bin.77]
MPSTSKPSLSCSPWAISLLLPFTVLLSAPSSNAAESLSTQQTTAQTTPLILAQTIPDDGASPSLDPLPEAEPLPPLPQPDEILGPEFTPPSPPETTVPEGDETTVTIQRFDIIGSTIFDEADFAPITADYLNRPITFRDVVAVRDAINQLYQDNGYITSGAIIPPQALQNSVAQLQVIEGSVEEIAIEGTDRLNTSYVRSRLARGSKTPLQIDRLLNRLQLLQLDPLIENISANLQAGTRPGTNLLVISVNEAEDSLDGSYTFDNNRSPSVGTHRHQLQVSQNNLSGNGDRLMVGYTFTEGSKDIDLGYTHFINADNGTASINLSSTDSNVIEDFDILDISSEATVAEVTLRQPIHQTPTEEFAVGMIASRQSTQTKLGIADIGGFPLSAGANDNGRSTVSALRFFQEWSKRSPQRVIALRSQFNVGLGGVFDSTINSGPDPDSRFVSWLGQGQWIQLLAEDTPLILKGSAQLTPDRLLTLERYGLGGQATVRGYRQDQLLTDSGFALSAEVRLPVWRNHDTLLQVTPFIEGGYGWNNQEADPNDNTLLAIGTGLRFSTGDLDARLDWGIPLINQPDDRNPLQDNGIYFSLNYSFL